MKTKYNEQILLKYIQSDSNELERAFELELNKIEGGIKLP